ncbi:hypothetical protein ACUXQ2_002586 [Cupriavidus metallidurans]
MPVKRNPSSATTTPNSRFSWRQSARWVWYLVRLDPNLYIYLLYLHGPSGPFFFVKSDAAQFALFAAA